MRRAMPVLAGLPRIKRFVGFSDAGPWDGPEPPARCPHCGSGGRYVYAFECEDGTRRGAMSGCVQLFPVHPIAQADKSLQERERDLRQRFGKDATLNSWDKRQREAVDAFYAGTMDEATALAVLRYEAAAKALAYRRRRNRW